MIGHVADIPSKVMPAARRKRMAVIGAFVVAIALAAAFAPAFAQPESYHRFADQRTLLGIPNFFDVVSNLAFLVVGVMGLHQVLRRVKNDRRSALERSSERWGWGVAFAAVALASFGSAFYHWAPDGPRLAWDRLPMAVGFMSLVAAVTAERISAKAGLILLAPLSLLGAASVWYWRWSVGHGGENLNFYGAVQFGSALIILLVIVLFPARYTRGEDWIGAAMLYALAKLCEHFDGAIFDATGSVVSGHTLKHLLAAAGTFWLLRMLTLRAPVSDAS